MLCCREAVIALTQQIHTESFAFFTVFSNKITIKLIYWAHFLNLFIHTQRN